MSEHQDENVLVQLRPFAHQVGGHTCVLQINQQTICKPFQEREVWFYENEPETLKEFTPKYLGETEVTCYEQNENKCLVASITNSLAERYNLTAVKEDSIFHSEDGRTFKKRRKSDSSARKDEILNEKTINTDSGDGLEIWSVKCIERQINRYGFWANNQPQRFIILENLVHGFEKPCLMDLKMGRRQFGDDSSVEKRKLLESRCASSTSATYGFRVCGAQIYKAKGCNYVFHDKYFGRALDNSGAVMELHDFFHNGIILRTDAIRGIVSKLEKLKTYLLSQDALHFFSCSLLLIYEGSAPDSVLNNCTDSASNASVQCSTDEVLGHIADTANTDVSASAIAASQQCKTNTRNEETPRVDVRLIDFAHVSEKSDGEVKSKCIDNTIAFGIVHLLKILNEALH